MELAIRPDDLYAASVALSSASTRLEEAALTFARRAQTDAPAVGVKAAEAVSRGAIAAEQAIGVVSTDIARLAAALASLAHHYPRVDATALRRR
jgi:hypothetical protein